MNDAGVILAHGGGHQWARRYGVFPPYTNEEMHHELLRAATVGYSAMVDYLQFRTVHVMNVPVTPDFPPTPAPAAPPSTSPLAAPPAEDVTVIDDSDSDTEAPSELDSLISDSESDDGDSGSGGSGSGGSGSKRKRGWGQGVPGHPRTWDLLIETVTQRMPVAALSKAQALKASQTGNTFLPQLRPLAIGAFFKLEYGMPIMQYDPSSEAQQIAAWLWVHARSVPKADANGAKFLSYLRQQFTEAAAQLNAPTLPANLPIIPGHRWTVFYEVSLESTLAGCVLLDKYERSNPSQTPRLRDTMEWVYSGITTNMKKRDAGRSGHRSRAPENAVRSAYRSNFMLNQMYSRLEAAGMRRGVHYVVKVHNATLKYVSSTLARLLEDLILLDRVIAYIKAKPAGSGTMFFDQCWEARAGQTVNVWTYIDPVTLLPDPTVDVSTLVRIRNLLQNSIITAMAVICPDGNYQRDVQAGKFRDEDGQDGTRELKYLRDVRCHEVQQFWPDLSLGLVDA
jgi:hypothetical protein